MPIKGGVRANRGILLKNAKRTTPEEVKLYKREEAIHEIVKNWSEEEMAQLILSEQGYARGYLKDWVKYANNTGFRFKPGIFDEATPEALKEKMLLEAFTELVARAQVDMKNMNTRNLMLNTFNGKIVENPPKKYGGGEIERVMRIWEYAEAVWRTKPGNAIPLAVNYKDVAQIGLDFVHSNERASE